MSGGRSVGSRPPGDAMWRLSGEEIPGGRRLRLVSLRSIEGHGERPMSCGELFDALVHVRIDSRPKYYRHGPYRIVGRSRSGRSRPGRA